VFENFLLSKLNSSGVGVFLVFCEDFCLSFYGFCLSFYGFCLSFFELEFFSKCPKKPADFRLRLSTDSKFWAFEAKM